MTRLRNAEGGSSLSARVGDPLNSRRFTVNLSAEISAELGDVAQRHCVSESSIVEVALRHLFRRVSAPALGAFLRDRGACLRRRS